MAPVSHICGVRAASAKVRSLGLTATSLLPRAVAAAASSMGSQPRPGTKCLSAGGKRSTVPMINNSTANTAPVHI